MPAGVGQQLLQARERLGLQAGREERVLAAVAGDAQLGQAHQVTPWARAAAIAARMLARL
jgi:hypothetical protein